MIEAQFSHYRTQVDEELINLVSDHYSKTEAKEKSKLLTAGSLLRQPAQIYQSPQTGN